MSDPLSTAIEILAIAGKVEPLVADWLGRAVASSPPDDPIASRVREVLPETSESARVEKELSNG